jgi:Xaa-Pro aminopeptidase
MHIEAASNFMIARQHGTSHMLGHGVQRRMFGVSRREVQLSKNMSLTMSGIETGRSRATER